MSRSKPPQLTLFLTKWTKSRYRSQSRLSALAGLADVPKCAATQPPFLRNFVLNNPTTSHKIFRYSNHFDSLSRKSCWISWFRPRESTWWVGRLKNEELTGSVFDHWLQQGDYDIQRASDSVAKPFDFWLGDGRQPEPHRPMASSRHSISGVSFPLSTLKDFF